tara:strand:+ start:923 stop:1207 length:285 start_codon:yes stop_codon:yes gene_type:complete
MKRNEVIKVAKKLTLENMEQLLYIFKDHIHIYYGILPKAKFCLTAELSKENPICLNGASIQINAEYTDQDNSFMKDHKEYLSENKKERKNNGKR